MEHKGYVGKVEYDDHASIFHGEVINTRDVITFQGKSVSELKKAFRNSVNDYLAFCKERGEEPDKPFSGQFATRIPPELHQQASIAAMLAGKSLNAWVTEQIQAATLRNPAPKRTVTKKGAEKSKSTKSKKAVRHTKAIES